jgi:hypothetical protein
MEILQPLLPYIFGNGGALAFAIWTIMDKKKQMKEMREEHREDIRHLSESYRTDTEKFTEERRAMYIEQQQREKLFYEQYSAMNEKSTIAMQNIANALEGLREVVKEVKAKV